MTVSGRKMTEFTVNGIDISGSKKIDKIDNTKMCKSLLFTPFFLLTYTLL